METAGRWVAKDLPPDSPVFNLALAVTMSIGGYHDGTGMKEAVRNLVGLLGNNPELRLPAAASLRPLQKTQKAWRIGHRRTRWARRFTPRPTTGFRLRDAITRLAAPDRGIR